MSIGKEVAAMQRMTVAQLRRKYTEVFGEETRSRHKQHLIRRIAWRLQGNADGGLSQRAHRRAAELAADSDVRLTASAALFDRRLHLSQVQLEFGLWAARACSSVLIKADP